MNQGWGGQGAYGGGDGWGDGEHSGVEVMVRDKMEDTVEGMEVALRDMEEDMESKVKAMVVVSHLQEEAQCEEAVLVLGEDIGKHHTLVELLLAEEEEEAVEVAEVVVKE